MDKQQIRFLLGQIQDRIGELHSNQEIGGDDCTDLMDWIKMILKELMYDDVVKQSPKDIWDMVKEISAHPDCISFGGLIAKEHIEDEIRDTLDGKLDEISDDLVKDIYQKNLTNIKDSCESYYDACFKNTSLSDYLELKY